MSNSSKLHCLIPQISPNPGKPINPPRLFPKPKYLCQKHDNSLQFKLKFDAIQELNENSQANLEDSVFFSKTNDNIFSNELNNDSDFCDKFIGPRFDPEGNLIKYSIIGKPDRFLRKYNQSIDYKRGLCDSKTSICTPKNSAFSNKDLEIQPKVDTVFRRRSVSRKTTFVQSGALNSNMARVIVKRNLIKMNGNQVKNEIRKIEDRIRVNHNNDQMLLRTLKRNDQLYLNKEQRIFKKTDENEMKWENQLIYLKNKVPRSKSEHLIQSSGDFRLKKEKAIIMDLLKTDQEKYGDKYWYLSLRNNLNEELSGMGTETLKAFDQAKINLKNNQIETIRVPSRNKEVYSEKVMNLINLRRDSKDEYLRKTLRENKRKFDILQPKETVEGTFNGFEVAELFLIINVDFYIDYWI